MSNLFKDTKFSYFFGPPSCFFQKYAYLCNPLHRKDKVGEIKFDFGEMAEWSNAAVLKTVDLNGSGGSNPSLSAINVGNQQITKQTPNFTPNNVKLGVFVLFKKTAERLCIDQ